MEKGLSGSYEEEGEKMTPITELLQLVCRTAETNCSLETKISPKELPASGGLYAEVGEGFTSTIYYSKQALKVVPVLILCRNKSQEAGMEQLCRICDYLQGLRSYPQGTLVSWLDTEIAKEPNKIGRDEDGMYHLSCILNCKIYY